MQFKKFDYQNPPQKGHYWIVTATPDVDVDVDGHGCTIGECNGDTLNDVVLAWLDFEGFPEQDPVIEVVDMGTFDSVCETATITHFAPFTVIRYNDIKDSLPE